MDRRDEWRKVLDAERARWSALSAAQLIEQLREGQAYEAEFESKTFQVEIELLENTDEYVYVSLAVDDGSLPWSISPASTSFICRKTTA